jgi:hypothetical protein
MGVHPTKSVPGACGSPACSPAPALLPVLALVLALLLPGGCGKKIDPDAPLQMRLNGNPYLPGVGQPIAAVEDLEAGFSDTKQVTVIFPLNALKSRPQPGLEIVFNPRQVPVGEEFTIGADEDGLGIRLSYHPFFGGITRDGQLLIFELGDGDTARLRFDEIDLEDRHLSGVVLEAVLHGQYVDMDGNAVEQGKPMEMHLSNFPFDVEIGEGLW